MNRILPEWAADIGIRVESSDTVTRLGKVVQVAGLVVESEGPQASLGDICDIVSPSTNLRIHAEVVGFRDHKILLMPLEDMEGVHPGCHVQLSAGVNQIPVGSEALGRVLDGLGNPIDQLGPIHFREENSRNRKIPNPLLRERITDRFETGVKAIDLFSPVGVGQRLGVFAGSGVGKSTLMGMLARGSDADVNVIALVGERGRELREFIEKDLGAEGLRKTVVVVATSDQSAPLRLRAANLATTIAENFRESGKRVLFLMDSVTRYAMAQREVGLAIGEPPASRGYTPSVFSKLPKLLERSGNSSKGSITAFYTVLVEGDDLNEPVSDAVRGILDGHIVLSRRLATAQDATKSASDKALYGTEFNKLKDQLRDIVGNGDNGTDALPNWNTSSATPSGSFNGIVLFGAREDMTIVVGATGDQTMSIGENNLRAIGGAISNLLWDNAVDGAQADINIDSASVIDTINDAIQQLATERAKIGGDLSRLEVADVQLRVQEENLGAANSRIRDVDVAVETTRMAKNQILTEASTSMLHRANELPRLALRLLN